MSNFIKFFSIIILGCTIAMLASCDDTMSTVQLDNGTATSLSTIELRTPQDAIDFALAFKNAQPESQSRSDIRANLADIRIISSNPSRSASDTLIYAVNYTNGEGYALISANPYVEPVLGYVEEGSFDEERTRENPSYNHFLNEAIKYSTNNNFIGIDTTIHILPFKIYVCDTIKPRVEVLWGQSYPEGHFFDNKSAGCVQTATAQVMSYIEKPTSIALTYTDRDKDSETNRLGKVKTTQTL